MKTTIALLMAAGSIASADIVINEVLGSTTGADTEFVELYNGSNAAVSLNGWTIELFESDAGQIGSSDGFGVLDLSGFSIAAGGYFLAANAEFSNFYAANVDLSFANNGIENSSYTIILKNNGVAVNSIFVSDGGDGDAANDGGTLITADATVGPDGSFLPAGFYRIGDGSANFGFLEFGERPAPSATPGAANIPAPAALAVLGLGGIAAGRRRR